MKIFVNFNEYVSTILRHDSIGSFHGLSDSQHTPEQQRIIQEGVHLVHDKINEILGSNNKLTSGRILLPKIEFTDLSPEFPNFAGYFLWSENKIGITTDQIESTQGCIKVFIHEYLHFHSHNSYNDQERITEANPIAQLNNVGFSRFFGIDIRSDTISATTSDYFLAFNEAVTEQLAIDILPGVHETYHEYRGLLNQVIADTVSRKLGSKNENGVFHPWDEDQVKKYIYRCYFTGNLEGFTTLLKETYRDYDISEQQFGLMTHKDDLPTMVEQQWILHYPDDSPPSPGAVKAMVQDRLDAKTHKDYLTDVIDSDPLNDDMSKSSHATEYDSFIKNNYIQIATITELGGRKYEIDTFGKIIYRGVESEAILNSIYDELDYLLAECSLGEINLSQVADRIDALLFDTHKISMLSDGFRKFFIYKHTRFDDFQS